MPRTQHELSRPAFVHDEGSIDHGTGGQIAWDDVGAAYTDENGHKSIPAGTFVSKNADGNLIPRSGVDIGVDTEQTAVGLLASNASEGQLSDAKTGYGVLIGGSVYEELLPDVGDADLETYKSEAEDAGTGFAYQVYADDRE